MDPTAQGNGAQTNNGQTHETGSQHEGFQKRIDELTAKLRQTEAERDQKDGVVAQLQQNTAELLTTIATMKTPQAAAEPLPEVDPEIQRHIDAATKPLMARIDQLTGAVAGRVMEMERREVAAKVGDDEVMKKAVSLQQQYAKQGVSADIETCVDIVVGKAVRTDRAKNATTDAARRNANGSYTVLTQGGSPMTGASGGQAQPGNPHPASAFTPEALNRVGSKGFSAAKLAETLDSMPDLPLAPVVRQG